MKQIHLIAGARPNFMKIAPLYHVLSQSKWAGSVIVHTGQHYDFNMSGVFLQDLGLPNPDIHLGVGSGTHAEQTGKIMMAYEKVLMDKTPDLVVVVGDVNSTLACALACVKLGIPIAHLEAGLRSFDRSMPEEVNRILTDAISDILWTPSPDGDKNLRREGVAQEKIHRVGNIMIDCFEMMRDRIERENSNRKFGLAPNNYGVVTIHRPSNVDQPEALERLCGSLVAISSRIPILFPVHSRTFKNLKAFGLLSRLEDEPKIRLTKPMSYVSFMSVVLHCKFALTDSGGIQEETTYLGIPCLTLRPNTERPITIEQGTNRLCKLENIEQSLDAILNDAHNVNRVPEMWDGQTAKRIEESMRLFFES